MDEIGHIADDKGRLGSLAVDGLLYGMAAGLVMFLWLAFVTVFSNHTPGDLLGLFASDGLTSPLQGLTTHLAVSSFYGMLFGTLIWSIIGRISTSNAAAWLAGLGYAGLLLLLAQMAILPGANSPLLQIPFWQWALGHLAYGLVLGGFFSRRDGRQRKT